MAQVSVYFRSFSVNESLIKILFLGSGHSKMRLLAGKCVCRSLTSNLACASFGYYLIPYVSADAITDKTSSYPSRFRIFETDWTWNVRKGIPGTEAGYQTNIRHEGAFEKRDRG